MRTDVPEDDPRILGTYKNCKESGRGFNGVEWWLVTCAIRGPIATARAKLEKSICPAFVTVTRFLDIPSYSLDKLCNYWSKIFQISWKYADKMRVSCALCFIFLWNDIPEDVKKMKHYFRHTYVYHYHHAHINHSSNMLTTWRDIPLTSARAFGKRFRPSVANVEGIWEYIILPGAGK